MPGFGASQSVSGRGGLNSGQFSKMCMRVDGVAEGAAVGQWTGPNNGGRPTPRGGAANRTGPNTSGPFFNSQNFGFRQFWTISGVTKDGDGVALASCTVHLFDTGTDTEVGETTSDGSGNYSFSVPGNSQADYAVGYKFGSPDVAGLTTNTLYPVLSNVPDAVGSVSIYLRDPTVADGPGGAAVFRPIGSPVVRRINL